MDKKTFGQIQARLLEVDKIIKELDESIRVAAFEFLKPYIVSRDIEVQHPESHGPPASDAPTADLESLVDKYGSDKKPADNAKLLAAYWFSQYGSAQFSLKWLRDTATSTGLTVPEAADMTFRQAQKKGKKLFEPIGKGGLFKPTVPGESYLKATFGVKKGTGTPPSEAQ